ncbi:MULTISPECIES: radical SAM family heme chaperone HemW [Empedobacter]|uniref:Heme chaperone HemW n=1 Tax=Empedobacter falsenii TaxID=343874 RepID=A0A376GA28_9FLAO|nr:MULTISPECIES: radical SAM family heme chaperone HemW [Empedobacter]MBW1617652.1 radical SAM family heme chaperone HemW [Empedobacter falsenii]MBY0066995.1 radical SAM family heme chaperone HemW [Empedobacter falsenii]MDM1137605.1 radical SAM family heme chaperone HemW [Empedobacter sp. R132-2]STD56103.1 Oxygen-independent coproporphyrinogen-III oxidase 2 [Empedobacter falsenii]
MAGIYIHIPFCKQKCSYCDFHFSTNLQHKSNLIQAINKELEIRKDEISTPLETIYFGGGTPSILSEIELESIFETIYKNYSTKNLKEITLEANPDDLNKEKLNFLKSTPINRFSIGVQSFFEEDLKLMNRAHNAQEAETSIKLAQDFGFENITIDLIYGSTTTTNEMWKQNLQKAIELNVPHISSYALTVEEKTILDHQIKKGITKPVDEDRQNEQFQLLVDTLTSNDFIQYEISNFGKEEYFSLHNSNYWKGIHYLGIGPSAHSYNGKTRAWNIANNSKYIQAINENNLPQEIEVLNEVEKFNEMIMIGLRTIYGIDLNRINSEFSQPLVNSFHQELNQLINENLVEKKENKIILKPEAKFFADGIASRLFYIN